MQKTVAMITLIFVLFSVLIIDVSAAGSSAESMYEEGLEYFEQKDYDRAFARFQISGDVREFAPAQNMLGICYWDGLGTETDLEEAERYFRLSADQGYTPAQENLMKLQESQNGKQEEWVLLYSAYYYSGELDSARKMTYNVNGKVLETVSLNSDADGLKQMTRETNYFDETGIPIHSETVDAETKNLVAQKDMEYNKEGKLLRRQTVDDLGNIRSEQKNSYSKEGSVLETIQYDDNEEIKSRSLTYRNTNNQTWKYENYNEFGEISYSYEIEYDGEGRKTGQYEISYSGNSDNIESAVNFEYNTDGVLIKSVEKYLTGGDYLTEADYVTVYDYDEYGNLMEERTTRGGEETTRHIQKWGLIQDGEIVRISAPDGFVDELEQAKYTWAKKSSGRISLEKTVLMDKNKVKVTAESYAADENREGIRLLFENNRVEDIKIRVPFLMVNDYRIVQNAYFTVKANSVLKDRLNIDIACLEAVGIDQIQSVSIGLEVLKDYEKQFESGVVTVPVHDSRYRVSMLIPIQKPVLEEDKLKIKLVGYRKYGSYADLYYYFENRSKEPVHIQSLDALINGGEGAKYSIIQDVEAESLALYHSSFYNSSYSKIDNLRLWSFGVELMTKSYNRFGKAEKIAMEFDSYGQLRNFEGFVTIDKSSDFWKNNFETSSIGFCPECGKEIEADSIFCMYCGNKII